MGSDEKVVSEQAQADYLWCQQRTIAFVDLQTVIVAGPSDHVGDTRFPCA